MNEELRSIFGRELIHAEELLSQDPSFDNLADAAEVLTRAANRVAPPGHTVRFVRARDDLDALELSERLSGGAL